MLMPMPIPMLIGAPTFDSGSMPTQIYGMPPLLSSVGLEIGTTPNPAQGIYLAPQKQIHEGWSPAPRRAFRSWS